MKSLIFICFALFSFNVFAIAQKIPVAVTVTGCENNDKVRDDLIDTLNESRPEMTVVPSGFDWQEKYEIICFGTNPKPAEAVDEKQEKKNQEIAGYGKIGDKLINRASNNCYKIKNDFWELVCYGGSSFGKNALDQRVTSYQKSHPHRFKLMAFDMRVVLKKWKSGEMPKFYVAPVKFIVEDKGKDIDSDPIYVVFQNSELQPALVDVENKTQVLASIPIVVGDKIKIVEIQKQLATRTLTDKRIIKEGR